MDEIISLLIGSVLGWMWHATYFPEKVPNIRIYLSPELLDLWVNKIRPVEPIE